MSSTTDPYQPLEARFLLTQRCLEVFSRYPDLDLLVIQTRSPLAERDFELIKRIPYAWLSVTVETDSQELVSKLGGGPALSRRLALVQAAVSVGIHSQIVVSPCLPFSERFPEMLAKSGAARIVIDNFVVGDGSGGTRTAHSPIAQLDWLDWRDQQPSQVLFEQLKARGAAASWSAEGFCSIPPRAVRELPVSA